MGGLVYPVSTPVAIFGTKTLPTSGAVPTVIATSATLTNAYTGNVKVLTTGGYSELVVMWKYTTGSGESASSLNIQLLGSNDNNNFYFLTNESATTGTSTLYTRTFNTGGGSAATAYSQSYRIDISYKFMKIQVEETGVSTNYGTLFMEGTLAGY
jgi:hypothetical protein